LVLKVTNINMFLKRPNQSEATSRKGRSTKNEVSEPGTGIHLFARFGWWFPVTSLLFIVYGLSLQFWHQARIVTMTDESDHPSLLTTH